LCFQETITDDLDVLEIDGSEKDEKQIWIWKSEFWRYHTYV
jgi:hypothetical protein